VSVVGAAYLVQGLVAAVGVLLQFRLALLGVSLEEQVGVLASGAIPWVLKAALALVLDLGPSWRLRTRALVLSGLQVGAAVCVGALAQVWVDGVPSSIFALGLGWFALNLCAAAQDVIVDALALDTLADHRPATATAMGSGVALGFYVLGMWIVGSRIDALGMRTALSWPLVWIAAIALLPTILLWRPERPKKARERPESRPPRDGMGVPTEAKRGSVLAGRPEIRLPSGRALLSLLWIPPLFVALTLAGNVTSAISAVFLVGELGWDFAGFFAYVIPIGGVASLLGALAWGPLVARLGPARAGLIGSALLGLIWIGFSLVEPLWSQRATIMALAGSEGLAQSAMMVALHALALVAAARTPLPTTAFVLAMASLNLARVLGPLVAPHAAELGWAGLFAACGIVQLLAGAAILVLVRDRDRTHRSPRSREPD
jgi:MFS transporter, PAT family, beta-lactamase induction signal transducer AmpG